MSDVSALFDDWASRGRAEGMEDGHLKTAAPLLQKLTWSHGDRVLDLGCGNAWAAAYAKSRSAKAVAVDMSKAMVQKAQERGIDAARVDMAKLPFIDHSFTQIWSMEALYYAPAPDTVLLEMARVLKKGGQVTIVIDYYRENTASHSWPEDVGVKMALRSSGAWCQALERAGFTHVQSDRLRAPKGPGIEDWKVTEGSLVLTARNG